MLPLIEDEAAAFTMTALAHNEEEHTDLGLVRGLRQFLKEKLSAMPSSHSYARGMKET